MKLECARGSLGPEEFETFADRGPADSLRSCLIREVPFYVEPSALSTAMGNHELGILGYW